MRWILSWVFVILSTATALLVSVIYALKFGEVTTHQMAIGWVFAYGWTFAIIEPVQICILAGAPCMFNEQHRCGRCMSWLRFCYNELLAP